MNQMNRMRGWILTLLVLMPGGCLWRDGRPETFRRLAMDEYVDRMKGGWIGQMAGVGWGGPTEFKYPGRIIPADEMPEWEPSLINQFHQDDLYVEMTFLRTLEMHGLDVSIRTAGLDFANSRYPLWHANRAGRSNLRRGIAPPDSGHPRFNRHADDIDYQIEADFSGLIAPGLPDTVIRLGETFGRLMNYGDGLYGGRFVGGMYAEAFFEKDMEKIVRAGLRCIPHESQYAECIRDVLDGWKRYPGDWEKTWGLINEKYNLNPDYRRFSCGGHGPDFNIDAKLNGAFIVMGLLYGENDPDRTIRISTRCGQDSDCNPSNAAGVLFTAIGFSRLPDRFKAALDPSRKFSHTPYGFPELVAVCKQLAGQAVLRAGGRIEEDAHGGEVLHIPCREPRPGKLEPCWNPGPVAGSPFSSAEMADLDIRFDDDMAAALQEFAPGWSVSDCGGAMETGLYREHRGRKEVLVTHPLNRGVGCLLSRRAVIPKEGKASLRLVVGHHPDGDWQLIVRAEGSELFNRVVGPGTVAGDWLTVEIDLSAWAGREVLLEVLNHPNDWAWEAAYWGEIALEMDGTANGVER